MTRRPHALRSIFLIALLLAGTGCAHYFVNEPQGRRSLETGYRMDRLAGEAAESSLSVCLAFSGGGTRAAALAYGVLLGLRDAKGEPGGRPLRLLDSVDYVSGVSGGSFTAAYYALFGDRIFRDFRDRFLDRNVQGEIERAIGRNAFWLWADHDFKRSDIVSEVYSESIFDKKTFGDLAARGKRPFLVVNATDMTNGQPFAFTQDQFDLLSSDLSTFPVGRAVAASAALPFFLSTITVRNHTKLEKRWDGFELPEGIARALEKGEEDPRLHEWARHEARYASGRGPSYLHLTDGGVSDNTGLRSIWADLRRADGPLRKRVESGRLRRLLVVSVNAVTDPLRGLGDTESAPGVTTVTEKTMRIAINNSTFETIRLLQEDRELQALFARAGVELVFVEVSFDRLQDAFRGERLRGLPTELRLDKDDAEDVIAAGREVLLGSAAFRKLLSDLAKD